MQIGSISMLLFFVGCTKQIQPLTEFQKEQNAIAELRKIVGNNGVITVIKKETISNTKSNSLDTLTKLISVEKFKNIYSLLNLKFNSSEIGVYYSIKDTSGFTTFNEGPVPKKYFIRFTSPFGQNLILNYGVDINNKVENPSVSLTGLPFTQINQVGVSNIEFNPFYQTSFFTVTFQYTCKIQLSDNQGGNIVSLSYINTFDLDFTIIATSSGIVGWR